MPKCPICGSPLDWIELENGHRVADDCPDCTMRGTVYADPEEESEDDDV